MKKTDRFWLQGTATALQNAYLTGFTKGAIFRGDSKAFCVPGLNCYSCPGAVGACPIGSLQGVLSGAGTQFSFYVLGFLLLFATLLGRVVCGFLCPFGWVQDLLFALPGKKWSLPPALHTLLSQVKYVVLVLFVVIFPMFLVNEFGMGDPTFCKWICPSGTLFGGIPLLSTNSGLREAVGGLFYWKFALLVGILVLSTKIYRPFCKYLCPLGAFYGLFHKVGLVQLQVDHQGCVGCKSCHKACDMGVEVTENPNSAQCIRCGQCKQACPHGCITTVTPFSPTQKSPPTM